jgi:glyceraldehyde 3-phosphate dehydrogenase
MLPASTGAALATIKALPGPAGRFDGVAVRVSIRVGPIADVVAVTARPVTRDEVNDAFREEAASDRYRGILGVAEDPVVSADPIGDPRASVVDVAMTRVVDGTLVKVMSWYDNERGVHLPDDPGSVRRPRPSGTRPHPGPPVTGEGT